MGFLRLAFSRRYVILTLVTLANPLLAMLALIQPWALAGLAGSLALTYIGFHDLFQKRHAILRSYPIAAHFRFLFEEIRPEIRQYFLESDTDGTPFNRDKRSIVYQRAKGQLDKRPFGTQRDVYATGFEWLNHSLNPADAAKAPFRITVGGPDCKQPYDLSVYNISAMSFGALSANAIRSLNKGAAMGGFAHDTGEGSISRYHREFGGDLIWEIGSGYFGCRTLDGKFSPENFARQAVDPQVKMIEIKLSQGAKPGHGGVLPGPKVTAEIAVTRGVQQGVDCVSPARHSAFSSPRELMDFIAQLRDLSGGKPVGFKLCIGHPWEFLSLCKAMLATQTYPDFIVIDGAEGGTGAAPLEFVDHIGMPLRDGLIFAHNALVGIGARDRIKIGAAGKITSAFDMARVMALGADWCNAARGFMFAVGCIQAQSCHTDRCPTGVATQDPVRQRAVVVEDKSVRVAHFHGSTIKALAEVIAAAGLTHPNQLRPHHISKRIGTSEVKSYAELYPWLKPNELLHGSDDHAYRHAWAMASADSFTPLIPTEVEEAPILT